MGRILLSGCLVLVLFAGVSLAADPCVDCACDDCDASAMCMPDDGYVSILPAAPMPRTVGAGCLSDDEWQAAPATADFETYMEEPEPSIFGPPLFLQFNSLLI